VEVVADGKVSLTALCLQGTRFAEGARDSALSLALGLATDNFSRECWPDALRRASAALDVARQNSDQ
jgi:hypothetical protein